MYGGLWPLAHGELSVIVWPLLNAALCFAVCKFASGPIGLAATVRQPKRKLSSKASDQMQSEQETRRTRETSKEDTLE